MTQSPRLRWTSKLRWILPLALAAALVTLDALVVRRVQLRVLPRGTVAPLTVRAATDAVFDLRKTYAEEARAARRNYLPIYDKDNRIFYETRASLMREAARHRWAWPEPAVDGGVDGAVDSAGGAVATDAAGGASGGRSDGALDTLLGDGADGSFGDGDEPSLTDPSAEQVEDALTPEQRHELEALLRGSFRLLEPYFKDGVIADNEFPSQKDQVRILSRISSGAGEEPTARARREQQQHGDVGEASRYVLVSVSELHRFSELRAALDRTARQFFFKSDDTLRGQVIDFILDRLPPNLTYAKENKRVIDISEVTGVKVVLIRRGEILARRGEIVSSRAYHAMRASVAAADRVSALQRAAGGFGLLAGLMLLLVVAAREVAPGLIQRLRPQLLLYGGLLVLGGSGLAALIHLPIHAALLPQAALALVFGVVVGRVPAMLVAVCVPAALGVIHVLDPASVAVGIGGGMAAAMAARRRRRAGVLAAGVLIGLVQAGGLEALRAVAGRPQIAPELEAATQAFVGGVLSGMVALIALPFVERWLGLCSEGKLRVLGDFEHPLARRLRERVPDVFAHTVRVVSLADRAANAVGADRLLTRCAALYHDLGRLEQRGGGCATPTDEARCEIEHALAGPRIAAECGVPEEVRRLIAEHHGTLVLGELSDHRHRGPKPQSVESAVLMIADQVEPASRVRPARKEEAAAIVDGVISRLVLEVQFDECGLTQAELQRIRDALVAYLVE